MSQSRDNTVVVNGEHRPLVGASLLSDFLSSIDVTPEEARGVAVALNDEVVRREDWGSVRIRPGDRLEVVTAKQGG